MLFAHHITSPAACVYPKLLTRRLSSHKNSVFFFLISSIFFCLSSACGRSIHLCAFSLLLIPLFRLRFVTLQKIEEKAIFLHFFKNIDIFVSVSPMHAMPKFNMLTILCWPNFSSTQLGIVLVVTEREVCGQGGVTGAEDENFLCAPPPSLAFLRRGRGEEGRYFLPVILHRCPPFSLPCLICYGSCVALGGGEIST